MFEHPTKKWPETINILALGPTNADFHAANYTYEPVVPDADETWTLNKGLRTQKSDVCFILDDLIGEMRRSERYYRSICAYKEPIITSIVDRDIDSFFPNNDIHEFPIWEIIDLWGEVCLRARILRKAYHYEILENVKNQKHQTAFQCLPDAFVRGEWSPADRRAAGKEIGAYFKNSIPMILGYAAFIGVEKIHLFGADYDFPGQSVHEKDKPNAEYWAAALRFSMGVSIRVSSRSTFLSTNEGASFYGYGQRQPWEPPCASA